MLHGGRRTILPWKDGHIAEGNLENGQRIHVATAESLRSSEVEIEGVGLARIAHAKLVQPFRSFLRTAEVSVDVCQMHLWTGADAQQAAKSLTHLQLPKQILRQTALARAARVVDQIASSGQ